MARPTFNGNPVTSGDLYRVMDHFEQRMDDQESCIEPRLRHLEDWKVEMETYARLLKWTLGASGLGVAIGLINLLGIAGLIRL